MHTAVPGCPHDAVQACLARRRGRAAVVAALVLLAHVQEAPAQVAIDPETAMNALVLIRGSRGGEPLQGSGFIVALDRERSIATVLTSSHVVEGATFEVRFHADPSAPPVKVAEVKDIQQEAKNGLAVFYVRNAPKAAIALELAARDDPHPRPGRDSLHLIGYPNMSTAAQVFTRPVTGRSGGLYSVDQRVGEGFSGGPALLSDKVVGLVSNTTDSTTSVVPFAVIRVFLESNDVRLVESRAAPASGTPAGAGGPAPSPAPAPPNPAVPARPTALVTSTMAVFSFPVDTAKRWRWNRPGAPVDQDEFSWIVTLATAAGPFKVLAGNLRHEGDRPREGNFKSFMEQTVLFALRNGQQVPATDLALTYEVTGDELLLVLTGPAFATMFAADSRPADASFEIVDPDNPAIQSWTEPIRFMFQFTLINQTGSDINNVWAAPGAEARFVQEAGLARWAPQGDDDFDLLGDLVLKSRGRAEASFVRESTSCDWVIAVRPVDEKKPDLFFTDVNLCRGSEVTLSLQRGQPKATVK